MSNRQRKTFALIALAVIAWFGIAQALDGIGIIAPKSPCEKRLCFLTPHGKVEYEKEYDCKFKDCHLANGEDIFRWAIGKKETGSTYGYDEPDENPCNAGNQYCAANTGNPASAGRKKFYAASYGTHQITLPLLLDWLNPNGKTKFDPPPDCIQKWFLDDKVIMESLKDAKKRLEWGKNLVSGRKVPAATVDKDGKITYPAVHATIKAQAVALKILIEGNADSEAEWKEMWERMAVWERLRQIIEAKWEETGGDKDKAWGIDAKGKVVYTNGLGLIPSAEYTSLLTRLGMKNTGAFYRGIKPYITTRQWNEAAVAFGNYALFSGAPANLYTRLMAFFANTDCHIAAIKQMFRLPKHGYDAKYADPKDAKTEQWVKNAAGAWNGSGSKGDYAKAVFEHYETYYAKHYGKTEVCR
ncbi:MAG: hypothetical protein ACOY5S_00395 [Pseudomonadota bacterium]